MSHTKKPISSRKILRNFLEKVQENGPADRKKDKTETITGLGRRTRQETLKWNQMTTLGEGGDQIYSRPPFGGIAEEQAG